MSPRSDAYCKAISRGQKGKAMPSIRGENHPNAKMTEASVIALRRLAATGNYSQRMLARHFDISRGAVVLILQGKTGNIYYEY